MDENIKNIRLPIIQVEATGKTTSNGREFSVESNFIFETDILSYFNRDFVNIFMMDMDNKQRFMLYIKNVGMNSIYYVGKLMGCVNEYIADHTFHYDPMVGLISYRLTDDPLNESPLEKAWGNKGTSDEFLRSLERELERHVQNEDYMEAARVRDQINSLNGGERQK